MEFGDDQISWSSSVCNFPAAFYFLPLSSKYIPQIRAIRVLQLWAFVVYYSLKFTFTCNSFWILPVNFTYRLNMSDKVLYPDNTTGRIIDLCILIYNFLDRRKDKGFETSSSKKSLNSIWFQIFLEWLFGLFASFTNISFELQQIYKVFLAVFFCEFYLHSVLFTRYTHLITSEFTSRPTFFPPDS